MLVRRGAVIQERGWTDQLKSGMKYFWELDGDASEKIAGKDGVASGSVSFEQGKMKRCARFNGGYFRLPAVTSETVDRYALSFWAKVYSTASGVALVTLYGTGSKFSGVRIAAEENSRLVLAFMYTGAFAVYFYMDKVLVQNWCHYVLQFHTGDMSQVFLNGILLEQVTAAGTAYIDPATACLGNDITQSGRNLNGQLEQVVMWNRILSSDEILLIYNKGRGLKY
jgi:hypothetical protein